MQKFFFNNISFNWGKTDAKKRIPMYNISMAPNLVTYVWKDKQMAYKNVITANSCYLE